MQDDRLENIAIGLGLGIVFLGATIALAWHYGFTWWEIVTGLLSLGALAGAVENWIHRETPTNRLDDPDDVTKDLW
jgi:L-lactate permease